MNKKRAGGWGVKLLATVIFKLTGFVGFHAVADPPLGCPNGAQHV